MIKDGSHDREFFEDCLRLLTLMREHADIAGTDKFWQASANHYTEICKKYNANNRSNMTMFCIISGLYDGFGKQYRQEQTRNTSERA